MKVPLSKKEKYLYAMSSDLSRQLLDAIETPSYFKQLLISQVQDTIENFFETKQIEIQEYYLIYGATKETKINTKV